MTLRLSHTTGQGVAECVERLLRWGHLGAAISVVRESACEIGCGDIEFAEVAVLKRWRAFIEDNGFQIVDARCAACNRAVWRVEGMLDPCEHCGGAVVTSRMRELVPASGKPELTTGPVVQGSIRVMVVGTQCPPFRSPEHHERGPLGGCC